VNRISSQGVLVRRLLVVVVLAALVGGALVGAGGGSASGSSDRVPAGSLQFHDPIRDGLTGAPLSCPDPSVTKYKQGPWNYVLVCTSDAAPNAFPIWKSIDLVHWYPDGWVFPHGKQPSWALPSTGATRDGRYWGPALYRIGGRWALYFATTYNTASQAIGDVEIDPHTMVLGVATSTSLGGPWHSELLHYRGELNAQNGPDAQERLGGDIDPAVVRDPSTGQLYLFWAEQTRQIWVAPLSANGLTVGPKLRLAVTTSRPWECAGGACVVEGPEPFFHDGKLYVLYSGASTWNSTYAVGVAATADPMGSEEPFDTDPNPILDSAPGFLGPGGVAQPVPNLAGRSMVMYHALLNDDTRHVSADRYLSMGAVNWVDGWPLIGDGRAGDSALSP
jgi:arabinan endo-1,5-alpha-L-arabinosidase